MNKLQLKPQFIKLTPETRLYQLPSPIIAITGGIATGKSSFCKILKSKYQFDIIDADQLVKDIYQRDDIKLQIKNWAPEAVIDNKVEFATLRSLFFSKPELQKKIEQLIYQNLPQVFIQKTQKNKNTVILYDIPLLFERQLQSFFDLTVLIYAPRNMQIKRVQQRDQTSIEVIDKILDKQIDIELKKKLADHIVLNEQDELHLLEKQAEEFIQYYFI